jgi:hypothetical protein
VRRETPMRAMLVATIGLCVAGIAVMIAILTVQL